MRYFRRCLSAVVSGLLLAASPAGYAEEKKATFAGGCFWCMEPPYDELEGVTDTVSGYAGGEIKNPSYEQVSSGKTQYIEVVQVTYDDEQVSYPELLRVFWANVDPYDNQGQFCDKGKQYRSGIFYHSEQQAQLARQSLQELRDKAIENKTIASFVRPLKNFYPAEQYHQNYYQEHSIRYKFYRASCGRDSRLDELWGEDRRGADDLLQ